MLSDTLRDNRVQLQPHATERPDDALAAQADPGGLPLDIQDEPGFIRTAMKDEISLLGRQIEDLVALKSRVLTVLQALKEELAAAESRFGMELAPWGLSTTMMVDGAEPQDFRADYGEQGQPPLTAELTVGPVLDLGSVSRLERDLKVLPGVGDVFVRRVEQGRAFIEISLETQIALVS